MVSDAELLAELLANGIPGKDAIALGRGLVSSAGSLGALVRGPWSGGPARTARPAGAHRRTSPGTAGTHRGDPEAGAAQPPEQLSVQPTLTNPCVSGDFLTARLYHLPYEVFGCLYLDNRHHVLGFKEFFRGTVDGTSVHPR